MRRCEFCKERYRADRRQGVRQRCCSKPACRSARHAASCREWRERHPVSATTASVKASAFRESHPDYWRERRRRPEVRARESKLQRERRKKATEGGRDVNRDALIVQVQQRPPLDLDDVSVAVREGNRDSIPANVAVFFGLMSAGVAVGPDDGKCDSMDREVGFWESRGRRVFERFESLRRRA